MRWKSDTATFVATDVEPDPAGAPAALVFAFYGDKVRWPTSSAAAGASPAAVSRNRLRTPSGAQAYEEAGATLGRVAYLGHFVLTDIGTGAVRYAPTYIGAVQGLTGAPPGGDSRGMQMVNVEDVAACYFAWDEPAGGGLHLRLSGKAAAFPGGRALSALTGG